MPEAYVHLRCETGGEIFEGKISWYGKPPIDAYLDRWNCTTLLEQLQNHHLETNKYLQHNSFLIFDSREQATTPDKPTDPIQSDVAYFQKYPSAIGHLTVTRQGNTAFHLQREPQQLLSHEEEFTAHLDPINRVLEKKFFAEGEADQLYEGIDKQLQSIIDQHWEPIALARYLRSYLQTHNSSPTGVTQKAITTIRSLIEDKGADPDVVLKQLEDEEKKNEVPDTGWLNELLKK